jgi:hypothetical protein
MSTRDFPNVSRRRLEALKAELVAHGVKVPSGDTGKIVAPPGVAVLVSYDEHRQVLHVEIEKKPFWVPARLVWETLNRGIWKDATLD